MNIQNPEERVEDTHLLIQSLESLLRLLVHTPKDKDVVLEDIQQQLNAGNNKEVKWPVISHSLGKIVGDDNWDIALLIVATIDPGINNIQTHFEQAKKVYGSFLNLLVIQEEKTAVLNAYRASSLKTLLRTQGSTHAQVKARREFLYNCLKTLTLNLIQPHKMTYYKKATGRIFDMTSSGEIDRAEECFQNAFLKFATSFPHLLPHKFKVYFEQTIRRELIGMQKESEEEGRILVAGSVTAYQNQKRTFTTRRSLKWQNGTE